MNFVFEEDKKNMLLDKLCGLPLRHQVKEFAIEDAVLSAKNLENLFKSNLLQSIQCLNLPKNSLGNKGIAPIFQSDRLRLIRKLDISSNNITGEEGGRIVADSKSFPSLACLDLRFNKLTHEGFRVLIQSKNYPALMSLKVDKNRLEDNGA